MKGLISTRGKNKTPRKSKKQYTKGNALANRPVECFYAILQREYLNVEGKIFENLEMLIKKSTHLLNDIIKLESKVLFHIWAQILILNNSLLKKFS